MNYKNYEKGQKKMEFKEFLKFYLSPTLQKSERKEKKRKISIYRTVFVWRWRSSISLQIISSPPSFKSIDYLSKTLQQHFHKHKTQRSIDSKLQKEQLSTLSLLSIELFYVCVLFNAQFDSMRLLFFTTNGFRCFHVRFIFSLFNFYLSMFRC